MPLNQGQVINNRYRVTRLLGQGGFGAVYRAWDLSLKKPCAVKQNFEISPEAHKQFEREAVLLARLNHPNLPRVTDHFTIPGEGQYLVMDYVEGQDLQEMIDRQGGPLPEDQVLVWIDQICEALTYLHSQTPPIIHRDIKPANIKITPDGRAVLVDFGIAKVYNPHLKTTVGARAITPGYSPLEQYGRGSTDARSDIYALGAMLYVLLTGRELPESTQRAVRDTVIPADQLNPRISRPVAAAIHQAIQIDSQKRPGQVADFKAALHSTSPFLVTEVIHQPTVVAQTHSTNQPGWQEPAFPLAADRAPTGVKWLPWAGLGAVSLILVLFLFSRVGREPEPPPENTQAQQTAFATLENDESSAGSDGALTSTAVVLPPDSTEPPDAVLTDPPPTSTSMPTAFPTETPSPPPTLTLSPTLSPTPQLPPVMVEAYCDKFGDSPVRVKQHQPVIIWWRWDAMTPQQVQDHIDSANYEIYLEGQPVFAERQSGIEYLGDKGWYRVSWFAAARYLSPGTYRSERYLSWDYQISDGWDTFGPGGTYETEWDFCEIIVEGN